MRVKSFITLRRLTLTLKLDDTVQITRAGSHYKARFKGRANFVFGSTREEAIVRLHRTPSTSFGFREVKG